MWRSMVALVTLTLALGCSSRHASQDSSESSPSSTSESSSESGDPCEPEACEQQCAVMVSDACELPYSGSCSADDACVCSPPSCPMCEEDEDCGMWATCLNGGCQPCGSMSLVGEAQGDCTIPMPDFPPSLAPFTWLGLEGETLPYSDSEDCNDEPGGWHWTNWDAELTLVLCPEACVLFEQGATLDIEWCIAGE